MEARGGPPEWLKKVPTEICVDRQKGHVVRVPESLQAIPLDQAVGDRWCSAILILNYVALREEGLRIGSLDGKKRLSSQLASDKDWRMSAERPKAIKVRAAKDVWVQRIVLQPPVEALPPPPPPSGFELLLAGQEPSVGSVRKLWYGPIPSGAVGDARCENQRLAWAAGSTGKDDLKPAQGVKDQGDRRLRVTEPDNARLVSLLREPLAVIVEAANSKLYCGVAAPVSGREREFQITLRPNQEKIASSSKEEKTTSTHAASCPSPCHPAQEGGGAECPTQACRSTGAEYHGHI